VFVFFVCNVLALVVNILEVMNINIVALNNMSNLLVSRRSKSFSDSINGESHAARGEQTCSCFEAQLKFLNCFIWQQKCHNT